MQEDGGDAKKVKIVNIGDSDFFTATKKNIDFAWIYYAWDGIEAELRGEKINMVYLPITARSSTTTRRCWPQSRR